MKRSLFASLTILASLASAGEVKTFTINADEWAEGEVPKEVFVVDGATTLELGVQNILDAANGHSAGRLRDSLESASGSL